MNAYGAKNVKGVTDGTSTPIGTSGITYNFLDKPELIRIQGKGAIQIIYDADGNKLQRKFTPETGAVSITTYINEFVYQNDSLSFINFEEGRLRVLNAFSANNGYDGLSIDGNMDLPNGKRGAYDYFIRDYQQNVRMILTEETHYGINQATMEPGRAGNEEPYFGQQGAGNEVAATRFAKPSGWASNTSANVSKLSKLTGHTIGPNSLLKVMAGDVFNAKADYYYPAPVTNNSNPLIGDIVTALMSAITGNPAASGVIHSGTGNISNDLTASVPFKSIADPHQTGAGNIPRAYLNVMFFNERFEFVQEGSTALRVSQPGDNAAPLVLSNIKAPKNGYVYIYLSNETDDPVYFDNFTISYTRGRIIEENHYYAFGLRITGISSRKYDGGMEGSLKNNYLYQGDFAELDEDIGWTDFELRNYDAQLGRWIQQDPFQQFASPYIGMGNNPINSIDPSGGWAAVGLFEGMTRAGIMATTTLGGAIVGMGVDLLSGGDGGKGLLIGAVVGLGSNLSFGTIFEKATPSIVAQGTKIAANVVNQAINNPFAQRVGYNLNQNDKWRKNGDPYPYKGGNVQNWTNDKNGKYAVFTSTVNNQRTVFPEVTITDFGVKDRTGFTTSNGAIHATRDFNLTLLQHEYGHYLQAKFYGSIVYNLRIVPASLYSIIIDPMNHNNYWTEKDANAWAAWFFGMDSEIGMDSGFPKEFSHLMNKLINH